MRLAFISDTHFGDPSCTLVDYATDKKGVKFDEFARAAGKQNDFLVLVGDIFDFSITSYKESFLQAKKFFRLVKQNRIAKNIIYLPGNHDFDMWHTVQQQIKIIYQVRQGRPAREFRWSLPGFLDDRIGSPSRGFQLPGVIGPVDPNRKPKTERLFLNGITKNPDGTGRDTNFYVAYPNMYVITDDESVLVTHGQYLETFWSIAGEMIRKIAQNDLPKADTLEDMVALNVPLCQLACSGIGQAGKLTPLIQKIQAQAKRGDLGKIKTYLDRFDDILDDISKAKLLKPKSWFRELFTDLISNEAKKSLLKALEKRDDTRFNEKFVSQEDVQERFKRFYKASLKEIQLLNDELGFAIKQPRRIIFGHTHQPTKWLDPKAPPIIIGNKNIMLYNTGGWLWKEKGKKKEFCGAEVFVYETGKGFSSNRIT